MLVFTSSEISLSLHLHLSLTGPGRIGLQDANAKIAADAAAAQAAYEAEKARRDAEYKAAMEKWQADVDACKAGDRTRCAPPATPK